MGGLGARRSRRPQTLSHYERIFRHALQVYHEQRSIAIPSAAGVRARVWVCPKIVGSPVGQAVNGLAEVAKGAGSALSLL